MYSFVLTTLLATLSLTAAQETGCQSAATVAENTAALTAFLETVTSLEGYEPAAPILEAATLSEPSMEPITILAPNNNAFSGVGTVTNETLTEVLQLHVIPMAFTSTELTTAIEGAGAAGFNATTISNATLIFMLTEDGSITVTAAGSNVTATVVLPDTQTCAGVVHVIDTVLMPGPEAMEEGSMMPPPMMPGMPPAPGAVTPAPTTPAPDSGAVGIAAALLPAILGAVALVVAM